MDSEINSNSFSGKAIIQIENEFDSLPDFINLNINVDGENYEISFNKAEYKKKFLAINRALGEIAGYFRLDYSDAPWFDDINW